MNCSYICYIFSMESIFLLCILRCITTNNKLVLQHGSVMYCFENDLNYFSRGNQWMCCYWPRYDIADGLIEHNLCCVGVLAQIDGNYHLSKCISKEKSTQKQIDKIVITVQKYIIIILPLESCQLQNTPLGPLVQLNQVILVLCCFK